MPGTENSQVKALIEVMAPFTTSISWPVHVIAAQHRNRVLAPFKRPICCCQRTPAEPRTSTRWARGRSRSSLLCLPRPAARYLLNGCNRSSHRQERQAGLLLVHEVALCLRAHLVHPRLLAAIERLRQLLGSSVGYRGQDKVRWLWPPPKIDDSGVHRARPRIMAHPHQKASAPPETSPRPCGGVPN